MILTVDDANLGVPEATWLSCPKLARCDRMSWTSSPRASRIVVLAPHPDDEVLAVGGTMRMLAESGFAIDLVAVTDGEASHPRSPTTSPEKMAVIRADERDEALTRLGIAINRSTRLSCPDGHVARVTDLSTRLAPLVAGASWCLAPWDRDGHPDHDATGRAAAMACDAMRVRLVQYPVWAWHWADPNGNDLPWSRVRRVPLTPRCLAAKRHAIAAYRSQIAAIGDRPGDEAVLPKSVLARFERPFEVVFA